MRPVADYVLDLFSDQELSKLDPLLDSIAEAVELLLSGQAKRAMDRFNNAPGNVTKLTK